MKTEFSISFFVKSKNPRQIDRLADWLSQKKNETGLSYPQIAERSGGLLTQATVYNVIAKTHESVREATVRGLAKAFDVTTFQLWDIINGVTDLDTPTIETRALPLPAELFRKLDSDAKRCQRADWTSQLTAILIAYYGGDVELNHQRLAEVRGDASIHPIDLDTDKHGAIPFTSTTAETPTKKAAKRAR